MKTRTWITRCAAVLGVLGVAAAVVRPCRGPSRPSRRQRPASAPAASTTRWPRPGSSTPAPASTTRRRSGRSRRATPVPSFNVDILGQGGVPAEVGGVNRDVLAVVANVTVVGPTAAGYLSISPTGSTPGSRRSSTSTPARPSRTSPSSVSVPAAQSTITIVTPTGTQPAHVLIDVFGWISKTDYPGHRRHRSPVRAGRPVTRASTPARYPVPAGWPSGRTMGAMEQLTLPIRGANGLVPNTAERHRRDGQHHRRQQSARQRADLPRRSRRRPRPPVSSRPPR